jgi:hypothetical protein
VVLAATHALEVLDHHHQDGLAQTGLDRNHRHGETVARHLNGRPSSSFSVLIYRGVLGPLEQLELITLVLEEVQVARDPLIFLELQRNLVWVVLTVVFAI